MDLTHSFPSGAVELPAVLLTYLSIENIGRRLSLAGFMTVR